MTMMGGSVHPVVVFWLGVLTGAVLVALVFGYKMLDAVEYQNRVLRYTAPTMSTYSIDSTEAVSIGIPPGGYVAIPTADAVSIGLPPGGMVR